MERPLKKRRCKADHVLRRVGTLCGKHGNAAVLKKHLSRDPVIPQTGEKHVDDLPAQAVQNLPGIFPGGGDAPGNGTHIACEAFAVLLFQVLKNGNAVQKILPLPPLGFHFRKGTAAARIDPQFVHAAEHTHLDLRRLIQRKRAADKDGRFGSGLCPADLCQLLTALHQCFPAALLFGNKAGTEDEAFLPVRQRVGRTDIAKQRLIMEPSDGVHQQLPVPAQLQGIRRIRAGHSHHPTAFRRKSNAAAPERGVNGCRQCCRKFRR